MLTKEKSFFQNLIGENKVITDIVETEKYYFAFFQSKKFVEFHGNDKYAMVGYGPLLYDKATGDARQLGSLEFMNNYYSEDLFPHQEEKALSYEKIKSNIRKRRHINSDEFEFLFSMIGVRLHKVKMYTYDERFFTIQLEFKEHIDRFIDFLDTVGLPFKKIDDLKIELDNG